MLITGIIGHGDNEKTANLINWILSSTGMKISVIDFRDICDTDERIVKSYINELGKNSIDVLIIKIGPSDTGKHILGYMHFDVMIYNDKADDLKGIDISDYNNRMRKLFLQLDEKGTAIVNADHSDLIQFLQGMKRYVVSYGFNPKASITASSTGDFLSEEGFLCCLQRTITARNGKLIEPQEYRVNFGTGEFDAYNVLAAATFAVVNGIDINIS